MNRDAEPVSLLFLAILLAGCSTFAEVIPPVHILKSLWDENLDAGRAYRRRALIRSNYPIGLVEVRLWHVNSIYEVASRVDNSARSSNVSLDVRLGIPRNAPTDDDCRLDVTACLRKTVASTSYSGSGNRHRVAVDNHSGGVI